MSVGVALIAFVVWSAFSRSGAYPAFAMEPMFQFAVGCVLGWSVFALEQGGAERFLGDQRLPRNRLWLAKVGGWLAGMLIVETIVAVDLQWQSRSHGFIFDDWGIRWVGRDLALGLLGFSAGQLFGIHDRRLPVTVFLTLIVVTPLGVAWYAPLFGGEPAWHFAVVPILFLAATRFEMRGWTAGRLDGGRSLDPLRVCRERRLRLDRSGSLASNRGSAGCRRAVRRRGEPDRNADRAGAKPSHRRGGPNKRNSVSNGFASAAMKVTCRRGTRVGVSRAWSWGKSHR